MNEEIKADWLTALRSGEYRQGKGSLKSQGMQGDGLSYCCLGVLCELAVKAGIVENSKVDEDAFIHTFDGHFTYLPPEVAAWAGINREGRIYLEGDSSGYSDRLASVDLAELNDYKLDFAGIADVIEREF